MPKKTEMEDPLGFFNIHSVAKLQNIEVGPFVGKVVFFKKVAQCRNNLKGHPLVSSGIVCYPGNLFGSVPWVPTGTFWRLLKILYNFW